MYHASYFPCLLVAFSFFFFTTALTFMTQMNNPHQLLHLFLAIISFNAVLHYSCCHYSLCLVLHDLGGPLLIIHLVPAASSAPGSHQISPQHCYLVSRLNIIQSPFVLAVLPPYGSGVYIMSSSVSLIFTSTSNIH